MFNSGHGPTVVQAISYQLTYGIIQFKFFPLVLIPSSCAILVV